MDTREKILSRAGLHEVLEEHRRASRKIVFAHGVFDLLHAGHVRHLAAARSEGDFLVVGVHSDAAAQKLKVGAARCSPNSPAPSSSPHSRPSITSWCSTKRT